MKKYFISALFAALLLPVLNLPAQVAINKDNNPPDPNAILDISSTESGFLIPKMPIVLRNAIPNPAQGLLIFNLQAETFNCFSENAWNEVLEDNLGNHIATQNLEMAGFEVDNGGLVVADSLLVSPKTIGVNPTNNRVGIGTISPQSDLHFYNFGNPINLVLTRGSSQFLKLTSDWKTASIGFKESPGKFVISPVSNIDDTILPGTGLTSDALGNVGIGTDSPTEKLEVHGGHMNIDNGSNSNLLFKNGSTLLARIGQSDNQMTIANEQSGKLIFKTDGQTRMTFNPGNGYIAIGDFSPAVQLDIDGEIQIRGGDPEEGFFLVADNAGHSIWKDLSLDRSNYVGSTTQHYGTNDDWRTVTDALHSNVVETGDLFIIRGMSMVDLPGDFDRNRDPFYFRVKIETASGTVVYTEEQIYVPPYDNADHGKERPVYYQDVYQATANDTYISFELQVKNTGDDEWDVTNRTLVVNQF